MKDLSGKVAVVTGGAGGIGKALCEELVGEGAKVVVSDVQVSGDLLRLKVRLRPVPVPSVATP